VAFPAGSLKDWQDIFGEGYLAVGGAGNSPANQDHRADTQFRRQTIVAGFPRRLSHFDDCTPGIIRGTRDSSIPICVRTRSTNLPHCARPLRVAWRRTIRGRLWCSSSLSFRPSGAANHGGALAFPPTLVNLPGRRLERAAAARIGGPTRSLKHSTRGLIGPARVDIFR